MVGEFKCEHPTSEHSTLNIEVERRYAICQTPHNAWPTLERPDFHDYECRLGVMQDQRGSGRNARPTRAGGSPAASQHGGATRLRRRRGYCQHDGLPARWATRLRRRRGYYRVPRPSPKASGDHAACHSQHGGATRVPSSSRLFFGMTDSFGSVDDRNRLTRTATQPSRFAATAGRLRTVDE